MVHGALLSPSPRRANRDPAFGSTRRGGWIWEVITQGRHRTNAAKLRAALKVVESSHASTCGSADGDSGRAEHPVQPQLQEPASATLEPLVAHCPPGGLWRPHRSSAALLPFSWEISSHPRASVLRTGSDSRLPLFPRASGALGLREYLPSGSSWIWPLACAV